MGDPIPLFTLSHAVYCLRQATLIGLKRAWVENHLTAESAVRREVATKGMLVRPSSVPQASAGFARSQTS